MSVFCCFRSRSLKSPECSNVVFTDHYKLLFVQYALKPSVDHPSSTTNESTEYSIRKNVNVDGAQIGFNIVKVQGIIIDHFSDFGIEIDSSDSYSSRKP